MVAYMIVDDSFFFGFGGLLHSSENMNQITWIKRKKKTEWNKRHSHPSEEVILGIGDTQNKILTHKKLQNKEYNKMRNMAYNKIAPESTFWKSGSDPIEGIMKKLIN